MKTTRTLTVLAAAALITSGCGGSNSGDSGGNAQSPTPSATTVNPSDMSNDQEAPTRLLIDVQIKGGEVVPTNQQLQAGLNEQIVLRVNSDAPDQLHVHSNPEHTFNIEAKPMQSFQFTVAVPGKVDVELHQLNKTVATIQVQ